MPGLKDVAGRELGPGDVVAGTFGNMSALGLFTIVSLTPKGAKCMPHQDMPSKGGLFVRALVGRPVQRSGAQLCFVRHGEDAE